MTNVTLVGSVGKASSASGSVTGAYGQTPTAGNLLVAVISAGDLFAESPDISTSATGWSRLRASTLGDGNSYVMVDAWAKTAVGSDAAPVFTQSLDAGSDPEMTCYIYELNAADLSAPLDTYAVYQQSSGSGTATFSLSSAAHVAAAGEFAIDIMCQMRSSSSSLTWTETGSGWTSAGKLPAGSSYISTQSNYKANPTSGVTLTDAGHFSSDSDAIAAGLMVVIAINPAVPVNISGVAAEFDVDGGVGSVTASSDVPGVAAEIVLTSGIGSASSGVNVSGIGVSAEIIIDGGVGSVSTTASVDISGVAAEIVLGGGTGFVTGGVTVNISGVAAEMVLYGGTGFIILPDSSGTVGPLTWDDQERYFSQGVSNGVLYPRNSPGVAWNGLISVTEKGDDSATGFYIDGQLIYNRIVPSAFSGTISAYMYPDEFEPYAGNVKILTGQPKPVFGFSYRTNREIHLVYNALAEPSDIQYGTLGDTVNPVAFSWDITTVPKAVPDGRPSAHLIVMLDYAYPGAVSDLENMIYGDSANAPSLPDPATVFSMFDAYAILSITDNGDGTWTATTSQDGIITMLDDITFEIDWASAVFTGTDTYKISSL